MRARRQKELTLTELQTTLFSWQKSGDGFLAWRTLNDHLRVTCDDLAKLHADLPTALHAITNMATPYQAGALLLRTLQFWHEGQHRLWQPNTQSTQGAEHYVNEIYTVIRNDALKEKLTVAADMYHVTHVDGVAIVRNTKLRGVYSIDYPSLEQRFPGCVNRLHACEALGLSGADMAPYVCAPHHPTAGTPLVLPATMTS